MSECFVTEVDGHIRENKLMSVPVYREEAEKVPDVVVEGNCVKEFRRGGRVNSCREVERMACKAVHNAFPRSC